MSLGKHVDDALNESRMLVLGVQVLLGFAFQGFFEPGFVRLPGWAPALKVASLVLLVAALMLLLTPTARHRITDRGRDTRELLRFTYAMLGAALLPFAAAVTIDLALASSRSLAPAGAWIFAACGALMALFLWYALPFAVRRRRETTAQEKDEMLETPLSDRIKQVLVEARVVLPGTQALLGFQLMTTLLDAFERLASASKVVHLASLGCATVSVLLLMLPAAWHRIAEKGEDTERLHDVASRAIVGALAALALAIGGDFFVVLGMFVGALLAIVAAAAITAVLLVAWLAMPFAMRRRA